MKSKGRINNKQGSSSSLILSSKALEVASLCFISIVVIAVNLLVILAYFKGSRRLKTKTNLFIINLAVTDFMVGAISIPVWILSLLNFIREEHYKYLIILDVLFGTTSIFSLTAISFERLFAVKFPTKHRNLNNPPFYIIIIIIWGIGIFTAGLRLNFPEDKKYYTLFVFVVAFILPLVIIFFCYSVIFYIGRSMRISSNQGNRDLQVAKKILIIIGLFVVFWLPFFTLNMCYYFGTPYLILKIQTSTGLISITKIMHYFNSMMNFFLYALRSPDFRITFKVLLCNRCRKRVSHECFRTLSNAHIMLPRSSQVHFLEESSISGDSSLPQTTSNQSLSKEQFDATTFTEK